MTDYHSHILPSVDDGADNIDESLGMLKALKASGFSRVVLSPHFYSNQEDVESFLSRRAAAYEVIKGKIDPTTMPSCLLGAEVYLTSLLFNNEELRPLTIDNSGYMLVELPYDPKYTPSMAANLERLVYNRDITPVLAHIDRYPFLMDKVLLGELFDMGCKAQVNLSAFGDKKGKKIKKLYKKGFSFVYGSDAHRIEGLYKRVLSDLDSLKELLGQDYTKENIL